MAAYTHADIAKAIDGLYEYRGFERRLEESPAESDHYWSPREHSGLYKMMEELEQAARQTVAWLQAMSTFQV
jgi:hypothetical protein